MNQKYFYTLSPAVTNTLRLLCDGAQFCRINPVRSWVSCYYCHYWLLFSQTPACSNNKLWSNFLVLSGTTPLISRQRNPSCCFLCMMLLLVNVVAPQATMFVVTLSNNGFGSTSFCSIWIQPKSLNDKLTSWSILVCVCVCVWEALSFLQDTKIWKIKRAHVVSVMQL